MDAGEVKGEEVEGTVFFWGRLMVSFLQEAVEGLLFQLAIPLPERGLAFGMEAVEVEC